MQRRNLLGYMGLYSLPIHSFAQNHHYFDVIVVGSGAAGLMAALFAQQSGAQKIAILEKRPLIGGHTLVSSGSVNVFDPHNPHGDSLEHFYQDTFLGGDQKGDPTLIWTMVEKSYQAFQFLVHLGIPFDAEPFEAYNGLFPRARHASSQRSGMIYIQYLAKAVQQAHIPIYFQHKAQQLLVNTEHEIKGIRIETPVGEKIFYSDNIILATGGFTGSEALRKRWIPQVPSYITTTYNPTNHKLDPSTGDGILMAENIGAQLQDMEAVMAIPYWGGRSLDYPGAEIFLNEKGVRFTDETAQWNDIFDDLQASQSQSFWVITDQQSIKGATFANKLRQKIIQSANTLEELAEIMHINTETLKNSLQEYNNAAHQKFDKKFGRTRFTQQINQPPYYVGKEQFHLHYCCGGIQINHKAQVKGKTSIIPGLFAAGETTGGIHGNFRLGGNGLTDAFVFGMIAGQEAGKRISSSKIT